MARHCLCKLIKTMKALKIILIATLLSLGQISWAQCPSEFSTLNYRFHPQLLQFRGHRDKLIGTVQSHELKPSEIKYLEIVDPHGEMIASAYEIISYPRPSHVRILF